MTLTQFQAYSAHYNIAISIAVTIGALMAALLMRARNISLPLPHLPLWALLIGALVLRLPLMFQPLWYDEAFTAAIIQSDDFFGAVSGDVHPTGYYLIVKAFTMLLGDSHFVLRLPALLCGLAMIVLVYRHNRHAAALLVIMPAHIYYSAEARYVMLLALLVVTTALIITKYDTDNGPDEPWLLVLSLAMMFFHTMGYVFAAANAVIIVLTRPRWRFGGMLLGTMVLGYFVPSWIGSGQIENVTADFWLELTHPLTWVIEMSSGLYNSSGLLQLVTIVATTAFIIVGIRQARWRADWRPFVLAWIVMMLVSLLWQPVFLPRVMLGAMVIIILAISHRPLVWYGMLTVFAINVIGLYTPSIRGGQLDYISLCEDADTVYATSIPIAILAQANTDFDVLAWEGGSNRHQQLKPSAMAEMLNVGAPSGDVCTYARLDYYSSHGERAYLDVLARCAASVQRIPDGIYEYVVLRGNTCPIGY